jgi:putative sterol carrier protein
MGIPESLIVSRPVPRIRAATVTRYFTADFFEEVANRLNADPEWSNKAASTTAKVVLACPDRNASFLIQVVNGRVSSTEAAPDVPADFKFEGTYDAWTQLGRGERDLQSLVMGGKIRFRGSMPKIMALMGVLNRITVIARDIPKDF